MSHSAPQSTETEASSVVAEIVEGLFYADDVVSEDCSLHTGGSATMKLLSASN